MSSTAACTQPTATFVRHKNKAGARTPRVVATTAALVMGLLLHTASLAMPRWAAGETYHLASSSAFRIDLAAGVWGYCATTTTHDATAPSAVADSMSTRCFAFHSTIGDQELSICEAFSRGFVYGTDDVRGLRFPAAASDNVHRIQRPPTSLDDVNIQRFIEKSCGVEGATTLTVSSISLVLAISTFVAFVWSLHKPQLRLIHELDAHAARANASILQFSSIAALAAVVVWLHQSWDLRQSDDTSERVTIYLGSAMYAQLLVALLYTTASIGILKVDEEQERMSGPILKI